MFGGVKSSNRHAGPTKRQFKTPSCTFWRIPSAARLHFLTCKRYGQFDELFSSRSTFSLSFSLFFYSLAPYSPPRLIFSLSLPLDGTTFHPSPRSSFRCKVHKRTRLGEETAGRGKLTSFRLRSSRRSENLACNLRQRWMMIRTVDRGINKTTEHPPCTHNSDCKIRQIILCFMYLLYYIF